MFMVKLIHVVEKKNHWAVLLENLLFYQIMSEVENIYVVDAGNLFFRKEL